MSVKYNRVNWKNNITLVNETNLNNMDKGIEDVVNQSNDNQERLSIVEISLENIDSRLSIISDKIDDFDNRLNIIDQSITNIDSRVTYLEENSFSTDLSNLPTVQNYTIRSYLYVDDDGTPSKININDLGNVVVEDSEGTINRNEIKFKEI